MLQCTVGYFEKLLWAKKMHCLLKIIFQINPYSRKLFLIVIFLHYRIKVLDCGEKKHKFQLDFAAFNFFSH